MSLHFRDVLRNLFHFVQFLQVAGHPTVVNCLQLPVLLKAWNVELLGFDSDEVGD